MNGPMSLLALVVAGLGLAAAGSGGWLWMTSSGRPVPTRGEVKGHERIEKEVVVGGRSASRSRVQMTRIAIGYTVDGQAHTLSVDRAHELAERDFPLGKTLDVFVDSERPAQAALTAADGRALPIVLLIAGLLLLLVAPVLFVLGRHA